MVAIDTGAGFAMALRGDGSVATWGSDYSGQLDVPADLGPVTAVAAGGYFSYRGIGVPDGVCGYALALRPDGTVVRWGGDGEGLGCDQIDARMDPPDGLNDVVAISAGSRQALALRSDHTVVAWGSGVAAGLDGTPPAYVVRRGRDISRIGQQPRAALGRHRAGLRHLGEAGPPRATDVAAVSASNIDLFLHLDTTISAYPGSPAGLPTSAVVSSAVSAGDNYGLAIEAADSSEPPPGTWAPALGSADVQSSVDSNPPGTAEAFTYTASRDATAADLPSLP